jgi:flagellar biosynthesis/type III secretory pathway protein FliH
MRLFNINKIASVIGLAAAIGFGVTAASAQGHNDQWNKQQNKIIKQQQKIDQQNRKIEQERQKQAANNRYRVNRGGQWQNVDRRQSQLLQQAINAGYQQGFQAGRSDRSSRRRMSWNNSNVYRSGSYGYQSYVSRDMYQYYFQQGFQKGYQDGYNSRNQYGNGGNILGSILQGILGLQQY